MDTPFWFVVTIKYSIDSNKVVVHNPHNCIHIALRPTLLYQICRHMWYVYDNYLQIFCKFTMMYMETN
jgi:hypothetical protein